MLKMCRGLYIPNTDVYPSHFRGMGIRIEDSVCIQAEHPLVLTTEAVKEVSTFLSTIMIRATFLAEVTELTYPLGRGYRSFADLTYDR